ncbi:hypothetical protein DFH07DRAFT_951971 [Mycena maculata]|uniref:Myb/SANT-like domain-containing protein n=1 Tax=Mycena maculata TaxID=230809 RepID=A0AAD7NUV0_9AGAR|nr:hypothetical protein DFH07DRAFT_951971 [Mycena maculata]
MPPGRDNGGRFTSPTRSRTRSRGRRTASGTESAIWTTPETKKLVDFLVDQVSRAGDGGNFLTAVWNEAAALLAPMLKDGGPKTAKVCRNKYTQLHGLFKVVREIKKVSGWHWDDNTGASITADTKSSWDDYVRVHPNAKPFRNKGWPYYSQLEELVPPETSSIHIYRPSQGTGAGDSDEDLVPSDDNDEQEDEDNNGGDNDEQEYEEMSHPRRARPPSPRWDIENSSSSPNTAASQTSFDAPARKQRQAATPGPSRRLRPPAPGPAALSQLASSVTDVSESLRSALGPPDRGGLPATPKRQMNAMARAQKLEGWLGDEKLAAFIEILEQDVHAADAYSTLTNDALRRAWITRRLKKTLGAEYDMMDMDLGMDMSGNLGYAPYNGQTF